MAGMTWLIAWHSIQNRPHNGGVKYDKLLSDVTDSALEGPKCWPSWRAGVMAACPETWRTRLEEDLLAVEILCRMCTPAPRLRLVK